MCGWDSGCQTGGVDKYDDFGGEAFFRALVADFYAGVAGDPVLRAMYPEDDLGPAQERLTLFLMQYWGGPSTYNEQRGHPRLRMRHAPYAIDEAFRDLWLRHMRAAVDSQELTQDLKDELWSYFEMAAQAMVNQPTEPVRAMLLDPPTARP